VRETGAPMRRRKVVDGSKSGAVKGIVCQALRLRECHCQQQTLEQAAHEDTYCGVD
jgi:hypothetical protein